MFGNSAVSAVDAYEIVVWRGMIVFESFNVGASCYYRKVFPVNRIERV
jgi:hypothetical protein